MATCRRCSKTAYMDFTSSSRGNQERRYLRTCESHTQKLVFDNLRGIFSIDLTSILVEVQTSIHSLCLSKTCLAWRYFQLASPTYLRLVSQLNDGPLRIFMMNARALKIPKVSVSMMHKRKPSDNLCGRIGDSNCAIQDHMIRKGNSMDIQLWKCTIVGTCYHTTLSTSLRLKPKSLPSMSSMS